MTIQTFNETRASIDFRFVKAWVRATIKELHRRKIVKSSEFSSLQIVFINRARSQKLNSKFRRKNKPTDVLSFAPTEAKSLGELALCVPILKEQAKDHKLSFNQEAGYLLTHGILHLFGFDHERGGVEARKMYLLQDDIFERLCDSLTPAKSEK
jgi:probable rRNA maturation factor